MRRRTGGTVLGEREEEGERERDRERGKKREKERESERDREREQGGERDGEDGNCKVVWNQGYILQDSKHPHRFIPFLVLFSFNSSSFSFSIQSWA